MFVLKGTTKIGHAVKRFCYAFSLDDAVRELLGLYDTEAMSGLRVESALTQQIERCVAGVPANREQVRARLYVLLRMRDTHYFIARDAALEPLRREVLRTLCRERDGHRCWNAVRELLLEQPQSWLPAGSGRGQRGKAQACSLATAHEHLSRRGSPIGQTLEFVALMHFDRDEECPPPNLVLRFPAHGFPRHRWETISPGMSPDVEAWVPRNPLCRWEYLAFDLAAALQGRPVAAQPEAASQAPTVPAPAEALVSMSCNVLLDGREPLARKQLELLQFEPQSFFAALQRKIHRELGAEGVDLYLALMRSLAAAAPGGSVTVSLSELAAPPGQVPALGQVRRRKRTMERLLAMLSHLEVQRVFREEDRCRLETAPLLILLGRCSEFPATSPIPHAAAAGAPGVPAAGESAPQCVRVLPDRLLTGGSAEAPTARLYQDVPASLLGLPSQAHPLALGLYLFLRWTWDGDAPGPLCRTAAELLEDAGFWMKPSARFKTVELLQAELQWLSALGLVGDWRIDRATPRQVLQDRYTVAPPPAAPGQAHGDGVIPVPAGEVACAHAG